MTPNEMKALRLEAMRLSVQFNQTIMAAALTANRNVTLEVALANSYDQAEEIVEYVLSGKKPKENTS